jgi:hypothetical protein
VLLGRLWGTPAFTTEVPAADVDEGGWRALNHGLEKKGLDFGIRFPLHKTFLKPLDPLIKAESY